MSSTQLAGGCQCGAVRYICTQPPLAVFVCHCTECRRQSASAFGISVQVPQAAFAVLRGEPRLWSRPTDNGYVLDCWFCPDCGTRLWHQRRGTTATLNIKGGSLDSGIDRMARSISGPRAVCPASSCLKTPRSSRTNHRRARTALATRSLGTFTRDCGRSGMLRRSIRQGPPCSSTSTTNCCAPGWPR